MSELPAVLPTRRGALERAVGFLESHLVQIRAAAITADSRGYKEAERLVLDATETAYAAGMLHEMAASEDSTERVRHVR